MKKENFSFSMVPNVPANAEFHFYYDDKITCKRIGKTEKVRYNYGEYSLSAAAMSAYEKMKGGYRNLNGTEYWLYEGKSLNKWRIENEQKKIDKIVDEHTSFLISTEKVVNFIENYPASSLKNWGDKFYGYPEEILKKMWDMVEGSEEEKLKKKICVLDDFGLQAHRFLIEKGVSPENIYFCISKDDESFLKIVKAVYSKLANSEKICSIFSLTNVFGDNKMFDLIIANPPYGLSNSIAKKIIPVLLSQASNVVVLVPKNTYKSKDLWEKVVKINVIKENLFEDASVQNLTVAKLSKDNPKNELDFEELILTEKQKVLRKAIKAYNTSHPTKLIRKVPFGNKVDPKIYKIGEVTLEEAIKQGRIFVNTVWTPLDGVHTNQAHDWVCNLQNKWPKEYFDKMPVNLTLFPDKQERDNFSKWWYSCLEKEQGKKLRSGLTNACLDLIRDCRSANGEGYLELFPQVDWSRSWTDAEILKELGLPEDFLEKKDE